MAVKLHVLVVEDHEASGRALKIMLERRGHKVTLAISGQQAIETVQALPFDLVLSDVGLPDIDGWALLAELRKYAPGLKAIAISGHGHGPDLQKSREAGFERHLTKPLQIHSVDEAIAALFPPTPEPAGG